MRDGVEGGFICPTSSHLPFLTGQGSSWEKPTPTHFLIASSSLSGVHQHSTSQTCRAVFHPSPIMKGQSGEGGASTKKKTALMETWEDTEGSCLNAVWLNLIQDEELKIHFLPGVQGLLRHMKKRFHYKKKKDSQDSLPWLRIFCGNGFSPRHIVSLYLILKNPGH